MYSVHIQSCHGLAVPIHIHIVLMEPINEHMQTLIICIFIQPRPFFSPCNVLPGIGDMTPLMLSPFFKDQLCSDTIWAIWIHIVLFPGWVLVLLPYLTYAVFHLWIYIQQYSRGGKYVHA